MTSQNRMAAGFGRRQVLNAIGVAGAAAALRPMRAFAQARRPFVAYLRGGTREAIAGDIEAFLDEMKRLGYNDGQNITIEWVFDGGDPRLQPELAAALVRRNPDVVFTGAGPAYAAVTAATSAIPIVTNSLPATYPPNVTGPVAVGAPTVADRFKLGLELVPGATRIGALVGSEAAQQEAANAAATIGKALVAAMYTTSDDVEAAFRTFTRQRVDFAHVPSNPITRGAAPRIIGHAASERLPTIYGIPDWVAGGGLISYSTDTRKAFRAMAGVIDKLLKGAKPADVPRQEVNTSVLAVNLATARALGLTIPPAVLARADEKVGA